MKPSYAIVNYFKKYFDYLQNSYIKCFANNNK